jgi:hypothetical protein
MSDWLDDDDNNDNGNLGFSVDEIDTSAIDLIPPGRYEVDCTRAVVKPSKNNPTTVLAEIEETIVGPTHAGRKVWSRYVVAHANPDVMARGRAEVARLMQAYGVGGSSLTPLVGRSCIASVDVEAAKDGYEAKNKVKRREPAQGAAHPAPSSGASSTTTSKPAASRSAPAFLGNRKA